MNVQFNFFLKNILLFYDIGENTISYGKRGKEGLVGIEQSVDSFFGDGKKDIAKDYVVWKKWNNVKNPFLFEKEAAKDIISYEILSPSVPENHQNDFQFIKLT